MSLHGTCACGAATIDIAADAPLTVRACWCRDCQKLAAGGPTHNAFFNSVDVTCQGPIRWHDVTAASGNGLARGFCADCGTPLLSRSHVRRHLIAVRTGVFDDTSAFAPKSLIWAESAPPWARFDPDLPRFDRQPPPVS